MKKIGYLSALLFVLFIACKKEKTGIPIESKTFEINATGTTTWKYFSFALNDTITVTDPATSTEWDLAFQRYRIKTNSGLSGNGQGSAANSYLKGQSGFDALKIVSDTATFALDDSTLIEVPQGYATYVVNPILMKWFAYDQTLLIPTDYIYIVKTGTAKYAKVWIKSYYNALATSGHITIQYKYQPDGSKNLE